MGFVQLAAPLQGDGGLLGKRGVESEDKTLQPKGFHVKLTPMGFPPLTHFLDSAFQINEVSRQGHSTAMPLKSKISVPHQPVFAVRR